MFAYRFHAMIPVMLPIFLLLVLCVGTFGCTNRLHEPAATPVVIEEQSPQQILLNQPDFVADQLSASMETRGGYSLTFHLAKKGEWYRSASDMTAVFVSPTEPTIRYFLKAKMFMPPVKENRTWYTNAQYAAILARENGVNFERLGEEPIDNHACVKIKATKPDDRDQVTVILYAAKDLNNLVIKTEEYLADRHNTYILKNISFNVSDDLFKILARRPRANI